MEWVGLRQRNEAAAAMEKAAVSWPTAHGSDESTQSTKWKRHPMCEAAAEKRQSTRLLQVSRDSVHVPPSARYGTCKQQRVWCGYGRSPDTPSSVKRGSSISKHVKWPRGKQHGHHSFAAACHETPFMSPEYNGAKSARSRVRPALAVIDRPPHRQLYAVAAETKTSTQRLCCILS